MPNTKIKNGKKTGATSTLDPAILTVKKAFPEADKAQLAKICKQIGATNHVQSVYNRLKKKDYLNMELSELENQLRQQLVRDTYPLAVKRATKALKNKDLDDKAAFPYVKLAYDKVHGETYRNVSQPGISIDSIQNAQIIVGNLLEPTKDDV